MLSAGDGDSAGLPMRHVTPRSLPPTYTSIMESAATSPGMYQRA
jgi:hypothetical protein